MKKTLFALMLVLISTGAMAKWTAAGSNDDYTVFVELDTIRKEGSLVKMWQLRSFKAVQLATGKKYSSMKMLAEFDCKKELNRPLVGTLYSGKMGLGMVVHTENVVEAWQPVESATEGKMLWKIACGKP